MNSNIIQSGRNDSSVLDRQGKDCPDVIETTVLKIPKKYRDDIKGLQERYNLCVGLMINISLKELGKICERDYPKIESYRGLKNFLLRTFGVTLYIYSQKTVRIQEDKNVVIIQKQIENEKH